MIEKIDRFYLEINSINELKAKRTLSDDFTLSEAEKSKFDLNKFFYKQIGKKHHWTDRLIWNDKDWIDYLNSKGKSTYILKENDNLVGFFELIFHEENLDCEIAYFGILEEYIGKKIGAYLLSEAIKKSFKNGSKRIWVHTCSLDHKHALDNYLSRGMKIFKSENMTL